MSLLVLISYASFGLKSWEDTPIDIVEDDGCSNMPKVPGLFSVRSPDSIDSHIVGNDTYIIIAEEVRTFSRPCTKKVICATQLILPRVMMSSTANLLRKLRLRMYSLAPHLDLQA